MRLLDLKYILVKFNDAVEGFVSFMPTYEDDYPVIYTYEIHLSTALQGWVSRFSNLSFERNTDSIRTGLASHLMKQLEIVSEKIPSIKKLMLTCFTSNERAIRFYQKLGYSKDEYSPPPRQLRDGTKIEAPYVILSKPVQSTIWCGYVKIKSVLEIWDFSPW